jgi:DNA-binding NarL/FixJ family response regulator
VQTSPFSPTPPELRSGRSLPAPRSDSARTTLRLFIGDADATFRRALRASLAVDASIDVVGEADDGAQAIELVRWLKPDVALVDEAMPSFGGAAIARILRAELPETRVVVLTRATAGARR